MYGGYVIKKVIYIGFGIFRGFKYPRQTLEPKPAAILKSDHSIFKNIWQLLSFIVDMPLEFICIRNVGLTYASDL